MQATIESVSINMAESEMNVTLEQLNKIELTKYLPVTLILIIIMCVGIVGKILVLFIYKRKFKRSSARVNILSLAISDLTVCVIGLPYDVLDLTLILTYSKIYLCKILSYFIGASAFSSIFILLVVGLDRYLKVCRPLKRQIVDFGDRKACVLAVFMAIVISVPNGILYGHSSVYTEVNNLTGVECFIADENMGSGLAFGYLGITLLVFLVSVILLVIMYAFICHTIYKSDASAGEITLQNRRKICICCSVESRDEEEDFGTEHIKLKNFKKSSDEGERKLSHVEEITTRNKGKFPRRETMIRHSRRQGTKIEEKNTRKITLMMMTITVVFIIAYLPFIIFSIMDNLDETLWDDLTVSKALIYDLLLRIYLINNAANPIIYSFWDLRFRRETLRLLKHIFFCSNACKKESKNNSNSSSSSTSTKITAGTTKLFPFAECWLF